MPRTRKAKLVEKKASAKGTRKKWCCEGANEFLPSGHTSPYPAPQKCKPALFAAQETVRRILVNSGVPHRYLEANVADFENVLPLDKSLYLYGPPGTGKTHMLCALAREFISYRKRVLFITMLRLLNEIKATFDVEASERECNVVSKYSEVDVLLLDDLGVERPTEWALQTVQLIVDNRYSECKQTIFTSNLDIAQVQRRFDERVARRIEEMCTFVRVE